MALGSATHKRSSCVKNVVSNLVTRDYKQTYPEWSTPANQASILLQDMLFYDTCILGQPIPLVSFEFVFK